MAGVLARDYNRIDVLEHQKVRISDRIGMRKTCEQGRHNNETHGEKKDRLKAQGSSSIIKNE